MKIKRILVATVPDKINFVKNCCRKGIHSRQIILTSSQPCNGTSAYLTSMSTNYGYQAVPRDREHEEKYHEINSESPSKGYGKLGFALIIGMVSLLAISASYTFMIAYQEKSSTVKNTLGHDIDFATSSTSNSSHLFLLESSAFSQNGTLPDIYTCKLENSTGIDGTSPPLQWNGAPDGTKEFLVAMVKETGYSWSVYNIPNDVFYLDADNTAWTTGGTIEFEDSKHVTKFSYDEPCSKGPGSRDYTFVVYAFSRRVQPILDLYKISRVNVNPIEILAFMNSSVLGMASLDVHFTLY